MPDILTTTQELMRIKSTAERPDELMRAVDYAHRLLAAKPDLQVRRFEHNGKPALVATTHDVLEPTVLMVGHLDVVPGSDVLFDPRIENGRLIGRGACDMKSEDAAMIHVLLDLADDPNRPSLGLMLTTDEEIGGRDGVRHLVEDMGYRCKIALVPDGGELAEDVVVASKGAVHLRLTATGSNAHGSAPWLGENAIDKLLAAYARIRQSFPELDPQDHWHTTCNLGTIAGGKATNQVPENASCTLDIRFPEPLTKEDILRRVATAAPECSIEEAAYANPCAVNLDDPYLAKYGHALRATQNLDIKACRNHGGHDGRFLSTHGIPAIVSRPLSGGQHTDHEWVDVKSLNDFYRTYLAFIRSCS